MVEKILSFLHTLPTELSLLLIFTSCCIFLITMLRLFSYTGLIVYVCIATIIANIQVLKAGQLLFYNSPIALGTIMFSSTFLATDILTECFGKKKAQMAIWLGFISMLFTTTSMNLTIGIPPLGPTADGSETHFNMAHDAMVTLFSPAPAIFASSMIAYLISQTNDIWLFGFIAKLTKNRFLFIRSFISTALSSLIDNIIFSTLAWKVLAINPVDNHTLIWSYILGTYILRLLMSIINIPIVYIGRYIIKLNRPQNSQPLI